MAISLITEVMDFAPATLTPQERVAAIVFAEDAWLHPNPADRNHERDRHIRTPLTDEMFQRRIGVGSAKKVLELAQSLARKGVLENVTRGQKWQRAEYKFASLTPAQQPGKRVAETQDVTPQRPGNWGTERRQEPGNRGAEGSQQPGKWGAAYIPPSTPSSCTPETEAEEDANASEPHPDAVAILDKVDLGGKVLVQKLRLEAERTLTAKLAEGWTVSALLRAFDGCAVGATNPPGAFMSRVRGLGAAPRARDSPLALDAVPKCSECNVDRLVEDDHGNRAPCPTCHPKRKAHP